MIPLIILSTLLACTSILITIRNDLDSYMRKYIRRKEILNKFKDIDNNLYSQPGYDKYYHPEFNLPSVYKVVFSFKPIKSKYWLSKEDFNKLNRYD